MEMIKLDISIYEPRILFGLVIFGLKTLSSTNLDTKES